MPFPFAFAWLNAIRAVRHSHNLTNAHYDIKDMPACDIFDGRVEEPLLTTDVGNVALSMISRVNKLHRVPIHVLMNQIGNLMCNRYNHCIMGTNPQQNWV